MARRVLMAEVSGGRVRGRSRLCWMDGVKVALGNRGMTVEAARLSRKIGKSGVPWYNNNHCDFLSSVSLVSEPQSVNLYICKLVLCDC